MLRHDHALRGCRGCLHWRALEWRHGLLREIGSVRLGLLSGMLLSLLLSLLLLGLLLLSLLLLLLSQQLIFAKLCK